MAEPAAAPDNSAHTVAAADVPTPPSDDPKAYAAWLAGLPRAQQRRVAALCRQDPTAYDFRCGGIGSLHIPYPPYERAMAWSPGMLKSRFASVDAWDAALSPAQHAYIRRHCTGGEDRPTSDLCGDNTPLVVVWGGEPVAYRAAPDGAGGGRGETFAFTPGAPAATDWPTAATPWLALDRDGDGAITSGAELFGNHTGGQSYANGFAALATLDANGDGVLDARDPAFARLVLWTDRDGDRASSPAELAPLAASVVSISLADHVDTRCDARGNCEGERAPLVGRDATGALHRGEVVDVYLATRPRPRY
jgi:hypothetical protein